MPRRLLFALLLLIAPLLPAQTAVSPWQMETSGTTASLRGVHSAGGGVVWASGTNGTVLRTEDSGYMWQTCAMPPGAEKLDFRAIWAWDANTAIVMSSGPGDLSRLYKTTDGCSHWTLLFTNPDKDGFWDALQFWDTDHGVILGDPIGQPDGHQPWAGPEFPLIYTSDAGQSWKRKFGGNGEDLRASPTGAGAFAASNSSLLVLFPHAWFGTGGKGGAFIYRGTYRGDEKTADAPSLGFAWQKQVSPVAGGSESSGVFSVDFRDAEHGLAVGGDYTKPREREGTAAWSQDGGAHWALSVGPPNGYRSAVAWDDADNLWITVGPSGSDFSRDDGKTWQAIELAPADTPKGGEWNALSLPWVVGPNGRIAKLNAEALPPARVRPKPPNGIRQRRPLSQ